MMEIMFYAILQLAIFQIVNSEGINRKSTDANENIILNMDPAEKEYLLQLPSFTQPNGTVISCPRTNTCPQWLPYNDWSDCKFPLHPNIYPQCYLSLQWRVADCSVDPNFCKQYEWRSCLENTTCLGQWSAWADYDKQCSELCTSGNKRRSRYCYKDGELQIGLCEGSYLANNQTQIQNCSKSDCVLGRQYPVIPGTEPNMIQNMTPFMFYIGIGLLAISLLVLITSLVYVKRKNSSEKNPRRNITEPSSTFIYMGEGNTQPPTSPTTPPRNVSPLPTPVNVFGRGQPPNLYQTINSVTTVSKLIGAADNAEAVAGTSSETAKPEYIRKLPSLPKRPRSKKSIKSRPRIFSKYSSVFDKVQTTQGAENEAYFASEELGPYTKMKSFSSQYSISGQSFSAGCSETGSLRSKNSSVSELSYAASRKRRNPTFYASAARVQKRKSTRRILKRNEIYIPTTLKRSQTAGAIVSRAIKTPVNEEGYLVPNTVVSNAKTVQTPDYVSIERNNTSPSETTENSTNVNE
ncbi:uncharacterized protein LOC144748333 isoform X2 [Ciona intestinalis]